MESIKDNCAFGLQGIGGQKETERPRDAFGNLGLDA